MLGDKRPASNALETSFGADVGVCVLEDLAAMAPGGWGLRAVAGAATLQSFFASSWAVATSKGRFLADFVVEYKSASLLNDPYEIEKRQAGESWARTSQARWLFGQKRPAKNGVGMAGRLATLLA